MPGREPYAVLTFSGRNLSSKGLRAVAREEAMLDVLYLGISVIFFAAAAAFVRGCARL